MQLNLLIISTICTTCQLNNIEGYSFNVQFNGSVLSSYSDNYLCNIISIVPLIDYNQVQLYFSLGCHHCHVICRNECGILI